MRIVGGGFGLICGVCGLGWCLAGRGRIVGGLEALVGWPWESSPLDGSERVWDMFGWARDVLVGLDAVTRWGLEGLRMG